MNAGDFEEILAKVFLLATEPDAVVKKAISGSRAIGS